MTWCGCLLLIALLVGGITFMIFGSTDPGEPIAQAARIALLLATAGALGRVAPAPFRRSLVRARRA